MRPVRNYLVRSLLYLLVDKSSDSFKLPAGRWCRVYVTLTRDKLYLQPNEDYGFSMPLSRVVKAERLKNGDFKVFPKNFMTVRLELKGESEDEDYSIIFSGPKSVIAPLWDAILHEVKKFKVQDEDRDLLRLLCLLNLGVRNPKSLGFLLNLDKEKVFKYLLKLYRTGIIDRLGNPTEKKLRKTVRIELEPGLDLEELVTHYRFSGFGGRGFER